MKTIARPIRWKKITNKLRFQIKVTKSSKRLQTLVKRLHAVNKDKKQVLKTSFFILLLFCACGKVSATNVTIEPHQAWDGTQCYVLVQDGEAKGISCK